MIKIMKGIVDRMIDFLILKNEVGWTSRIISIGFQLGLTLIAILNIYYVCTVFTEDLIFRLLTCITFFFIFVLLTIGTIMEGYRIHFSKKDTNTEG